MLMSFQKAVFKSAAYIKCGSSSMKVLIQLDFEEQLSPSSPALSPCHMRSTKPCAGMARYCCHQEASPDQWCAADIAASRWRPEKKVISGTEVGNRIYINKNMKTVIYRKKRHSNC